MSSNKTAIIAGGIVILVVLAAGFWYFSRGGGERAATPEEGAGANTVVYEKPLNPIKDELPQTNPFEAKTNPFEGAYKNPFDR